jgi:hypothetical protein
VSAGAGTGRTTVAALLAAVLAATRGGPTVAVDAHLGPGSLTDRLAPGHDVPAGELLGLFDHPALSGGELLACLAGPRPDGPAVVGVGGPPAPGRRAWTLLVHGLARHADALVLDCGPGLGDPGARAAIANADQLVLVTEPAPSPGSRRVAGALADLGHAVVVVAAGAGSGGAAAAALARLLPGVRGWCRSRHRPLPGRPAGGPRSRRGGVAPPWSSPRCSPPTGRPSASRRRAADRPAAPSLLLPGSSNPQARPPNGLPQTQLSAILQRVDVWPSGREPARSEVGIAPTSVL